eukprot:CAMPEP_0172674928 /NCGR_PEP_ID=MMETSP1074-20121228/13002_1 /TAXON_ID=2916 /ORGANISM="Ceratium fusus, Strain PA161109" /LENGTH=429 /DNA_ID=CAMNT_0013492371 /DNA_START=100 /DNA_END=1389 /DNA_ORIENTATION=+
MRGMGFSAQGQQQSDQCSMTVCTICRAPIRLSYFVILMVGYQLTQVALRHGQTSLPLWWELMQQVLEFTILYATVLCHEFGHGNMARRLGGEIDHILLWIFGGICFSTRQPTHDNRKILRDEFLIVAAGPMTHFFQAPAWGLVLCAVFFVCPQLDNTRPFFEHPGEAFLAALLPWGSGLAQVWMPLAFAGQWGSALLWSTVGVAIQLNVALFLFNVFFPMYPADGSKLLVTSLMFCCGVPARRAACILLCVTIPCGILFIGYSLMALSRGLSAGYGGTAAVNSISGFMGVMSLVEAYKIWELRKARRLHTHPLFQAARSWNRTERDVFGNVHRINVSDFDDDDPLHSNFRCKDLLCCRSEESSDRSCLSCCCPCLFGQRDAGQDLVSTRASTAATEEIRARRMQILAQVDMQASDRQRTVRDLVDSRAA